MKWTTGRSYKIGNIRTVYPFALFPVNLINGTTVWFEYYKRTEVLKYSGYDGFEWQLLLAEPDDRIGL